MALKDPYVFTGALFGFALILLYVASEVRRRGDFSLINLSQVISLGNMGRVIGLLWAAESVTGGLNLVVISLTVVLPEPFDPWDWLYVLTGGIGAFWVGLVGIVEMFALSKRAVPGSDTE